MEHLPYPTDVSDPEWALAAPYLTLMPADAPQREYSVRDVFNGLRWPVQAGATWRLLPHDLPPWAAVYQQTQRWLHAGVVERSFGWLARFRRLARDYERLPETLAGLHFVAFAILMPKRIVQSVDQVVQSNIIIRTLPKGASEWDQRVAEV